MCNWYSAGGCPFGSFPVNCFINPCQFAACPAVEGAICVADYCGGCSARWLLNGQEVTSQCEGKLHNLLIYTTSIERHTDIGHIIQPLPQFFLSSVTSCTPARVWTNYVPNTAYNIYYTIGCPDGSQPVHCLVHPCQFASCPAIKDAKCVADYCGGCNARWYLKDKEVTHMCCKSFSLNCTRMWWCTSQWFQVDKCIFKREP